MIETFLYGKRYWYPHMKPNDIAIWERFIDMYPSAFDYVQYDVPCGSTPEFDTVVNEDTGGVADMLYKKRIDVVAFKGDHITVIELKPRAGAAAVGQVKLYLRLYKKDYSPPSEPDAAIITDSVLADVREYARDEGVLITVV
jgi:hypothetical protein